METKHADHNRQLSPEGVFFPLLIDGEMKREVNVSEFVGMQGCCEV